MPYLLIKLKIFDLADSWWLWKWLLTSGVTKRLFNSDLEYGVVCDQRASRPQSWRKVTKRLLNLGTWRKAIKWLLNLETEAVMLIKGLLYFNVDERQSKDFSTLEIEEKQSKGFSTLKPELECWSRDFSTSILMKGNQRASQPWNLKKGNQRASQPRYRSCNVDQRASQLRFGLLKCRSEDLSTSI